MEKKSEQREKKIPQIIFTQLDDQPKITGGSDVTLVCQTCADTEVKQRHQQQHIDSLKQRHQQQQQQIDLLENQNSKLNSNVNLLQNNNFELREQLKELSARHNINGGGGRNSTISTAEYDKLVELNKLQTDEINSLKTQIDKNIIAVAEFDMLKTLNQKHVNTIGKLRAHIERYRIDKSTMKNSTTPTVELQAIPTLAFPSTLNQEQPSKLSAAKEKLNELQQQHDEDKKLITNFEDEVSRLEKENKQLRIKLKKSSQLVTNY